LTLQGISPLYAVAAFVAGEILAALVSVKFLLNRVKPLKHVTPAKEYRKVFDVAYTVIFTSMSVLLYTQADVWILGMYAPTDVVGVYGVSAKLVLLVYFPMMALASIIPSIISSVHATGNTEELRKVTRESTRWILSMSIPIMLVLTIEGKHLLRYVYGPEFTAGYVPLLILLSGQLIKAGAGLIGVLLQMTGQHKIYMKVNIFWGVVNIILNILLVPRYGMIGAAIATAVCLSMVDIISIFIIRKRLAIITLARGLSFDLLFIAAVAIVYFLFSYNKFYIGHHVLFVVSLCVYLWKSIKHHDVPWQRLLPGGGITSD
jgi:O-antigen/teichoic acid export membrane protein